MPQPRRFDPVRLSVEGLEGRELPAVGSWLVEPFQRGTTSTAPLPSNWAQWTSAAGQPVFAVDSVPAVFAITQEPFVVYTSNIFAILGLRSLYFALAAMVHRFHYLKYALALVLVFIGAKIFLSGWIGKFPSELSLGITLALLAGGILFSLWKTKSGDGEQARSRVEQH